MKHLTILSVSVAAILFTGAHFQNRFNKIYNDTKKTEQAISVQVNNVKCQSDSLLISTGSKATAKAVTKAERNTFRLIGKLVQSVF